jgi:hypothetical protein
MTARVHFKEKIVDRESERALGKNERIGGKLPIVLV